MRDGNVRLDRAGTVVHSDVWALCKAYETLMAERAFVAPLRGWCGSKSCMARMKDGTLTGSRLTRHSTNSTSRSKCTTSFVRVSVLPVVLYDLEPAAHITAGLSDVGMCVQVGDVLLTYENEVILTNEVYGDKALPYLVPSYNIRIECPLALVDRVVENRGPEVHKAATTFCSFLFTAAAQGEFAKLGFRVNSRTCREVANQQTGLPPAQLWQVGP